MPLDTDDERDYDRELAGKIQEYLFLNDYKWNIDSTPTTPNEQDVLDVLKRAKEYVADGGIIEIARLVVIKPKDDDQYDVYVHIGTVGD